MGADVVSMKALPQGSPSLLIDVREVARLTGLSPRTVWRLVSAGGMPAPLRVGGRRLWRREELVQWIEAGAPRIVQ